MFKTNYSSPGQRYKKPGACFNEQKRRKQFTFPIFDNEFSSSSKQLKIGPKYFVFQSNRFNK